MCLIVKENALPRIAMKNMLVYKELSCSNRPLHYPLKPYTTDLRELYLIDILNSKVDLKVKTRWGYPFSDECRIEEGYHSWAKWSWGRRPHLFIIPKGTLYYKGRENRKRRGYVSETIIFAGPNTKENRKRVKEKYNV
jgi:hypothetical protein